MENKTSETLVLWDIDGTLVDLFDFISPTYNKIFKELFDIEISPKEYEKGFGLPEYDTIALPLRNRNFSEEKIKKEMKNIVSKRNEILGNAIKENQVVLKGVPNLLKEIKKKGIPQGIVTGNSKEMGEKILESNNLIEYFNKDINSYASPGVSRKEIVKKAIDSAKKEKLIEENPKVYVLGDTVHDITAAKENNCQSIAIINNKTKPLGEKEFEERKKSFEEAGASLILNDLTDTKKILSFIDN